MSLTLLKELKEGRRSKVICRCKCGAKVVIDVWDFKSGHRKTCGSQECTSLYLSTLRTGKPRPDMLGKKPGNWVDRTGQRHRKLFFLKQIKGTRWLCRCDCGNKTEILTTNLAKTNGCRYCAHRRDITGERRGMLVAQSAVESVSKGQRLWTFLCDCGNTVQETVQHFHMGWLRSCGCHDNAYASWKAMMERCYYKKCNRYYCYGARGIKVCKRWHKFENFIADMGERPKRHNLSRKNCEKDYSPSNCLWEHVSKNNADTQNGKPTKPGLLKGARPRKKLSKGEL